VNICTLDNLSIIPESDEMGRYLHFHALGSATKFWTVGITNHFVGERDIRLMRSHLYARTYIRPVPDFYPTKDNYVIKSYNYGVIICNENIEYAAALMRRCRVPERCERLAETTHWLAWDAYHELNDWPEILEATRTQLRLEQARARNQADLHLAQALHQQVVALKELEEAIRYIYSSTSVVAIKLQLTERSIQEEIYSAKFTYTPSSSLNEQIHKLLRRFCGYKSVVDVLTQQTLMLTDLVRSLSF
jgi:hypothetical protein